MAKEDVPRKMLLVHLVVLSRDNLDNNFNRMVVMTLEVEDTDVEPVVMEVVAVAMEEEVEAMTAEAEAEAEAVATEDMTVADVVDVEVAVVPTFNFFLHDALRS